MIMVNENILPFFMKDNILYQFFTTAKKLLTVISKSLKNGFRMLDMIRGHRVIWNFDAHGK